MPECNRWVVMRESEGEEEGEGEREGEVTSRNRSGTFGDSGKVLYFCGGGERGRRGGGREGGGFEYGLFDEGWSCHVETIPY